MQAIKRKTELLIGLICSWLDPSVSTCGMVGEDDSLNLPWCIKSLGTGVYISNRTQLDCDLVCGYNLLSVSIFDISDRNIQDMLRRG